MPAAVLQEYITAVGNMLPVSGKNLTAEPFRPINAGGLGGFPWQWSLPAGFNYLTYLFVDHCFSLGKDGLLYPNDSFSTDYSTVISSINFQLSSADLATLNKEATLQQLNGQAVVQSYLQNISVITAADFYNASSALHFDISTKLDFIILYQVAYVWSGQKSAGLPPLSLTQMVQASDLSSLMKNAPSNAQSIIQLVSKYLSATPETNAILDSLGNANNLIAVLTQHTEHPDSTNGGLVAIDTDGTRLNLPGYLIQPSPEEILAALSQVSAPTVIEIEVNADQQGQVLVNVNQQGAVIAPNDFFRLISNDGAQNTLFSLAGAGKTAIVKMTYPGMTQVTISASSYDAGANTGWFSADPVTASVANGVKDVSGFHFSPQPAFDFRNGGNFGLLSELLISQHPVIEIHYADGDPALLSQHFMPSVSWNFQLGTLPKICGDDFLYTPFPEPGEAQGMNVKFMPNVALGATGTLDSLAYVIGGRILWPGA